MVNIAILSVGDAVGSYIMGTVDFFQFCNTFQTLFLPESEQRLFHCQLYCPEGEYVTCSNGFSLPAKPISELKQADALFMVPCHTYDMATIESYISKTEAFHPVLTRHVEAGAWVAGNCSATFALAHAGLLDDGRATTLWWMKNLFGECFPKVDIVMDELVVRHQNVITGGATTAYLNVCLMLLEQLGSMQMAAQMSKVLLLDRQRLSQQAFINTEFLVNRPDTLIDDVQAWLISHYQQSITLDQICEQFAVTKRTLIRRFKAASGETPLNYLQKIRVERAKHFLESTDLAIERIVEKVGYGDPASFRKLFVAQTQLTPKQYRQRFSYHALPQ